MKRRGFLGASAAIVGALSAPSWVSRAFAQAATPGELAALSDAYRRAQRAGRPLLVLVVPEQNERRDPRASAFGELLNHGPDTAMADLALAELACATMTTLRTLVPQAPRGEPLMVLVEPDAVPATARALDAELPTTSEHFIHDETTYEERERRDAAIIDQRIALLARLVHGGIAPDAATLGRRVALVRSRLSSTELARIDRGIASRHPTPRDVALAPALVALAAVRAPELNRALIELGTQRWRRDRIPGSRWAVGGGCGLHVEQTEAEAQGSPMMMMACGMGYVPARSARFLYWFSDS